MVGTLRCHHFIGLRCQAVESVFQLLPGRLLLARIGVATQGQRVTVKEESATKRQGDEKTIPGRQEFFFELEKTTGTMGAPESREAAMTPAWTRARGPRGPSGVSAASYPARILRTISRNPEAPRRELEPRAVEKPNRSMVRLMYSPSR